MFILDTNVVPEIRKIRPGTAHPYVALWADSVNASSLYLSAIIVFELELGILQLERKNPRQGSILRRWLESCVLPEFEDRILPVDARVARCCASLHVPDPRSGRDAMIAATARVHGMTVVTRNQGDFERTGVPWLNPWHLPG